MKIKGINFRKKDASPGKASAQRSSITPIIRKKRRLKYIAVLPSFITLMNGVCGFLAIILAGRSSNMGSFSMPGFLIFLAMLADMLDGRIARLTRTTSSFGGQLDSLSDAISFGVAPAFIMIKVIEFHLLNLNLELSNLPLLLDRVIIFSAIFYAMCTILRLARFNVENVEDESAHMSFSGLPSPAAAGVIASLIIFHQQILNRLKEMDALILQNFELITVIALPLVAFSTGLLMVSRIQYPHVANQLFRSKKPLPVFTAFFAAGLFLIWNIQLVLTIGFCGFALFGLIRWILGRFFRKKPPREPLNT